MERVQLVPVPELAAPAYAAALPCGARHAVVADFTFWKFGADARQPRIIKVIEAEEVIRKTGYSRPHTAHCGPASIYINALGDAEGGGPGGIFVMDPETFEIKGRWEKDRGPQRRPPMICRPFSRASARCHRLSPISTSRSTIDPLRLVLGHGRAEAIRRL